MVEAPHRVTNRLLGYPDDARLLLLNADDFGMYDDVNDGVVRALTEGIVRSTSLMVPCPGASRAIKWLREHPETPFAVHLSIVNDIPGYRWGPMAPRESVSSLLDEDGNLFLNERRDDMLARATLDEVESEFRAQIAPVVAVGLRPTHLDWHCLHSGGRADIFDMTRGLARELGVALRVGSSPHIEQIRRDGLPAADYDLLDSFRVDIDTKADIYAGMLRALPAGLTEWAVHPGIGTAASQAIDPDGWRVRRSDFEFLVSPRAREIVEQEGIILIDYRPLQAIWEELAA